MALAIQGLNMVAQVREVGDTEWLTIVCEIDSQMQLTNDVTEVDTKCGTFAGIKTLKANISGNAVYNVDPEAAEVTWNDIAQWQIDTALLEFLYKNTAFTATDGSPIADGAVIHVFNTGQFVDSTIQGTVGELGKFSWTFKPSGIPVLGGASG